MFSELLPLMRDGWLQPKSSCQKKESQRTELVRCQTLEERGAAMPSADPLITRAIDMLTRMPIPASIWRSNRIAELITSWKESDGTFQRNGNPLLAGDHRDPAFALGPSVAGTYGLLRTNVEDLRHVMVHQVLYTLVAYASFVDVRRMIAEHCGLTPPEAQLLLFQNVRVQSRLNELGTAVAWFNTQAWLEEHYAELPRMRWPKTLCGSSVGLTHAPVPFTNLGLFDLNGRAFNPFEDRFGRRVPQDVQTIADLLRVEAAGRLDVLYGPSHQPPVVTESVTANASPS